MKEANELGRCGCGKDLAQHSHEDFKACALRFGGTITEDGGGYIFLQSVAPERPESRAEFMASECCICNRIFGHHSDAELQECLRKRRERETDG